MDFTALLHWVIRSVIYIVLIVGAFRVVKEYLSGSAIGKTKDEVWHMVVICLFLGTLPALGPLAMTTGEAIMTPAESVIKYVTKSITDSVTTTVKE